MKNALVAVFVFYSYDINDQSGSSAENGSKLGILKNLNKFRGINGKKWKMREKPALMSFNR